MSFVGRKPSTGFFVFDMIFTKSLFNCNFVGVDDSTKFVCQKDSIWNIEIGRKFPQFHKENESPNSWKLLTLPLTLLHYQDKNTFSIYSFFECWSLTYISVVMRGSSLPKSKILLYSFIFMWDTKDNQKIHNTQSEISWSILVLSTMCQWWIAPCRRVSFVAHVDKIKYCFVKATWNSQTKTNLLCLTLCRTSRFVYVLP